MAEGQLQIEQIAVDLVTPLLEPDTHTDSEGIHADHAYTSRACARACCWMHLCDGGWRSACLQVGLLARLHRLKRLHDTHFRPRHLAKLFLLFWGKLARVLAASLLAMIL